MEKNMTLDLQAAPVIAEETLATNFAELAEYELAVVGGGNGESSLC